MFSKSVHRTFWLIAALLLAAPAFGEGVRIKDITDVAGARSNQLYGFGLVTGLDGTGGKSAFTQKVAVDMLQKLQVGSKIAADLKGDNVYKSETISAVMVTAEIGPYARRGSRFDVIVSVVDDAKSLQGGTLMLTPLRAVDGEVYAVATGPLSVGGFSFSGKAASAQKNHPTVGRVPNGATVEREALGEILCKGQIRLLLKEPDYVTAKATGKAINDLFPSSTITLDAGTLNIFVPPERIGNLVGFVSEIGLLEVVPDTPARVVINARTGTIVSGEQVKLSTVNIAHGSLSIVTSEAAEVSQPAPFSKGNTTVVPRTTVGVTEQSGTLHLIHRAVTVAELARALNSLGVTPRDLIDIFQALKQAGALHADLVIM